MISQREVQRKYAKLITKEAQGITINNYVCESCGHITKTNDKHEGTTPMIIDCTECGRYAKSTWYKDMIPNEKVTHEWVVPTLRECMKKRTNTDYLDHVFRGGLVLKSIE